MLRFAATRIFLVVGPTDMRKAYDTLATIVRHELKKDPLRGQLFVFANRKHNRLKILVWDHGGFWLCSRLLEKGTFAWPSAGTSYVEMRREELGQPQAGFGGPSVLSFPRPSREPDGAAGKPGALPARRARRLARGGFGAPAYVA